MATRTAPTLADIEAAQQRLEGIARVTPVSSSETLSRLSGRPVWLKAELLQAFDDYQRGKLGVVPATYVPHGSVGGTA